MPGGYLQSISPDDAPQQRVRQDNDLMHDGIMFSIAVADAGANTFGQVLEKVAAQCDINNLQAAANAEHRDTPGDGLLRQSNLSGVAVWVHGMDAVVACCAIKIGRDVAAASEHQGITAR
ncbi:hypothetical protein A4H96_13485 [Acidithiobacillus ferrooxidans]|uniref:Uncharacterized protein n=1 Tax=Acidithiobacillus ferrooxidans TaxID=920 RepID=A0A179B812_ACIFR|nr:hypothetical protein A4H96_13485 [Acidithiobacillus ferrooxidans]